MARIYHEEMSAYFHYHSLEELSDDARARGLAIPLEADRGKVQSALARRVQVGCFSVGTNQVDLPAAQRQGVPVFNAPFSNTRSVAELTLSEIIMLMRRVLPKSTSAHQFP